MQGGDERDMRQPVWTPFEVVLLIEAYLQIEKGIITKKEAVSSISRILREHAISEGKQIDDTYRNENGISMRLEELRYIFTHGENGIKKTSSLFRNMVKMYQQHPDEFQDTLKSSKAMFSLSRSICARNNSKALQLDSDGNINHKEEDKIDTISVIRDIIPDRIINSNELLMNPKIHEAASLIDADLLKACIESPNKVIPVISCLKNFTAAVYSVDLEHQILSKEQPEQLVPKIHCPNPLVIRTGNNVAKRLAFTNALERIPRDYYDLLFFPFLYAYSQNRDLISAIKREANPDWTLREFANNYESSQEELNIKAVSFLEWCSSRFDDVLNQFIDSIYENEREKYVIEMRVQKQTLDNIGQKLGVSKERVRQIENKTRRKFSLWLKKGALHSIVALNNGNCLIDENQQAKLFKTHMPVLHYLFATSSKTENFNAIYGAKLVIINSPLLPDTFSVVDSVRRSVMCLPNSFESDQLDEQISKLEAPNTMSSTQIKQCIELEYKLSGTLYHRSGLSLSEIYSHIIYKYYPEGIHLDSTEMVTFRQYIETEFGNVKIPDNNRAIYVIIQRNCILCGRGKYMLRSLVEIPFHLCQIIFLYIQNSNEVIFLTNILYYTFEKQLLEAGITNKYFLQGIMRDQYGDKLFITRDYISKDPNITSIYTTVIDYIQSFDYPVSKEQIKLHFSGLTEIMFSLATSDENILNYYGKYIHISRLKITAKDVYYLRSVIQKLLMKKSIIHNKDVYAFIQYDCPELLERLYTELPIHLYSVLEHYCKEDFSFQRPYISNFGTEISNISDRLFAWIKNSKIVKINDIVDFCKNNHYQMTSLINYLNTLNDRFLIISSDEIADINYIGITEELAKHVERMILEEIDRCVYIADLDCIHEFPKVNVLWSEWLIYSVIIKWGNRLEVSTSSNQFRFASPLVAPIGKMDLSVVAEEEKHTPRSVQLTDDLDQIDDLIADFLDDEFDYGEDEIQYEL